VRSLAGKPLISLIVIFVVTVVADQVTKHWAQQALLDEGFQAEQDQYPVCGGPDQDRERERFLIRHRESVQVIDGFWNFKYVENCASAFGMLRSLPETFRYPFFLLVSLAALIFIPYFYRKTPPDQKLMLFALPFVLAGAVGNLLDRILHRYVIDFIQWYVRIGGEEHYWPTFNIADAAIVVGIGLMLLQMFPRKGADSSK
jgi:signal peptidase II